LKKIVLFIVFVLLGFQGIAQSESIWIEPNAGQWSEKVNHRVKIPKGHLYLDESGFFYSLSNIADILHHHEEGHDHDEEIELLEQHYIKTEFVDAKFDQFSQTGKSKHYNNYYIGNNQKKWASKVHSYANVEYQNIYPGINLEFYGLSSSLKYNFIVQAGANLNQIKIKYSGQSRLKLDKNGLSIKTKFGTIEEKNPIAYYQDSKESIDVEFVLVDDQLTFQFPNGYDNSRPIIIDPEIVFSTFTGATTDNWGNTACPGSDGTLFAGGISFGAGYPTTAGAFQTNWAGGDPNLNIQGTDVVISKFSEDGSQLLYSTFLGGAKNEIPHSMITNSNNELFVYGSTCSADFPVSATAFQSNVNLSLTTETVNSIAFNLTDIFVTRLNADGTAILGSTYYGGDGFDGISLNNNLIVNYGDQFRGEIMIDASNNIYITGTTQSTDLPMVNPIKSTIGGTADAFVAKFNSDLSSLLFSTYLGGDSFDSGNSIQLASNGDIFVGGGTNETTFMSAHSTAYKNTPLGERDGYIVKINGSTFGLESIRFITSSSYDQTYFVQIDQDDDIYAYGQTQGDFAAFGCVLAQSNRAQFVMKFNNDLDTVIWATSFGSSDGKINISPTAFLVNDCGKIYISGWGGTTNSISGFVQNTNTLNLTTTNGAFQTQTNGSNFYIVVFDANMSGINYATYMGGTGSSSNHVDGGTSRFDKNGNIYHAVCAACGGAQNGFTSTQGAYSETNNSPNCNMAAFKFKLIDVEAALSAPNGIICLPNSVQFENDSQNGNIFMWYFGDGDSSSVFEPNYLYDGPGTYTVTLVAIDTTECFQTDTTTLQVEIGIYQGEVTQPQDTICPGESIQLNADNGIIYHWEPAGLVNDPSSNSPIATVDSTTVFTVIVGDSCGSDTLSIVVPVHNVSNFNINDAGMCEGDSVQLNASGGIAYHWEPDQFVLNNNVATPFVNPPTTMDFYVDITTPEGCIVRDTVNVEVLNDPPSDFIPDDETICLGEEVHFELDPAYDYLWSPDYNISSTTSHSVDVNPLIDTTYFLEVSNICGVTYDTVHVKVIQIQAGISQDTTICKGSSLPVAAFGGQFYHWYPESYFDDFSAQNPIVTPPYPTDIWVEVTDTNGCTDSDTMFIEFYPTTFLTVSPDYYGLEGDTATIWASATGPGQLFWTPAEFIECTSCDTTLVFPPHNMTYIANFLDTNGCLITDHVTIHFDPILYVPNAFTPNGDGMNDFFGAKGGNFATFELLIFNRWGELIFEGQHIDDWWDGKYKGELVQDGVYVWKIRYEDFNGNIEVLYGHVTSLR
jgi:gliding motility-associated-like protein